MILKTLLRNQINKCSPILIVDSSPIDALGSAKPQVLDKSTLINRLRRVKQIDVDIILLDLIFSIAFKSSFLLTNIIANIIKTLTAPT